MHTFTGDSRYTSVCVAASGPAAGSRSHSGVLYVPEKDAVGGGKTVVGY